jgi:hypothetical protein
MNAESARLGVEPATSWRQLTSDMAKTFGEAVMFGNVYALSSLDRLLAAKGHTPEVRIGGELSMADLAERPVILVGYFNNPWAKTLVADKLRFTLSTERVDGVYRHAIRDRNDPARAWSIQSDRPWFEDTPIAYAVVTRLCDTRSGAYLVSVAGMTHLGTSAAAEFITRASSLEELRQHAPRGWEKRNLQVVLQTSIVNRTAAPPKLIATHFW